MTCILVVDGTAYVGTDIPLLCLSISATSIISYDLKRELDRIPVERDRRAQESVRIAASLKPKPLRYQHAPRRVGVFWPPRCATPARFAFYQGCF